MINYNDTEDVWARIFLDEIRRVRPPSQSLSPLAPHLGHPGSLPFEVAGLKPVAGLHLGLSDSRNTWSLPCEVK